MGRLTLDIANETLRLAQPFRIAGHVFDSSDVIVVTLSEGGRSGRGEASGVFFFKETVESMRAQLEAAREAIEAWPTREALRFILSPGGARNAVDAALWDLEAACTGIPVWKLAGMDAPKPLRTTFTLGADTPEVMAQGAVGYVQAKSIKIKLTGDLPLDQARVRAIRAARPDAWLGVDGNQGFVRADLDGLVEVLVEERVSLLEQPLARGHEHELEGFDSPIPIAADESCVSLADVATMVGRFQVINIKLDKCGGLTEGLLMAARARLLGLGVMVGTMVGTSLATAPGFVLGQVCDLVDLDGATFLAQDRPPGAVYRDGTVWAGDDVWGGPAQAAAA
jgi:L-alanine-DL-glutamate epimerase-like enolase superfamily enzyme